MSIYLGIDPGKKGALALLDSETLRVSCHDMPGTTQELHDLVAGLPMIKATALEKLFTGPAMGRKTLCTMFMNFGILKGALMWRDIPFREIEPSKWKAALGLSKDKNASREMAMQLFPDDAEQFKRVKDDGRAEAALLAYWGMQK
ncbi:hypothetical protein AN189_17550 [Loktanella sp. 3ANDIMAR09]|uniref:hypothetical protein n=1 Tax=Loktanella sp. 3ANDIMAR09 TaxID=1225657 RepID=UPI0006F2AEB7|nr:hypothetical protein [Loktanella sp. 3ANDIMAR09]KQI67029.1 hypothetical protein AN189_17550 [Loktanella sp. 3ANDIMAR09]